MDWFFPGAGCTVLLANGDFPRHPVPLTILRRAGSLICCDGAAANLPAGIEPDAVVGDGDSLPPAARLPLSLDLRWHEQRQAAALLLLLSAPERRAGPPIR